MLKPRSVLLALILLSSVVSAVVAVSAAEPVKTGEERETLLYIRTDPPGAKVLINGEEVGTSDGLFKVEPGSGTILVELEGRKPGERQVIIRANAITRVELSLEPKVEPKAEPLADPQGPQFVGRWAEGSVELVGVTKYPPTKESQWWKPNGLPTELGTFLPQTSQGPSHPHENSVAMLFHFTNPPDGTSRAWKSTPSAGWWADTVVDENGETIKGYAMLIPDFKKPIETANLRVGIDAGPWETVVTQKSDGLGVSSFSRAGHESTITFLKAETRDNGGEDSTRVTLMSSDPYGKWRKRLVAVAKDETEHTTGIGYMDSNGTADFRGLPPASIQEFRYQVRPFQWVEFKNISLEPGLETNVEAVSSGGMVTLARPGEADGVGLSGTWLATAMEKDGKKASKDAVKRMRFRFEGKKLFARGNFDEDREEECSFSIDDTKTPKHLDFTPPWEKKPILAIYERKGKTLRICLRHGNSDKGRPTEFKTTPDSDLVLMVFGLKEGEKRGGQPE